MQKVPVDLEKLKFSFQDFSLDNSYYLDTESGDILLVNQGLLDLKELTNEIELNRHRYLYIPKPDPNRLKEDLRDYWTELEEGKIKNLLEIAFESSHILSAFKKILAADEKLSGELEEFLESRTLVRVKQWLEGNCLEIAERVED